MAAKFYRKLSPESLPILGNGASVKFSTLDQVVGYYSTDNDYIQSEFARFANEQRYGITEIPFEEFNADYLQKKNSSPDLAPLRRPWREEMGSGVSALNQISQTRENANAAVAVKNSDIPQKTVPIAVATPTKDLVAAQPVAQEFKPKTQKRGAKKPA